MKIFYAIFTLFIPLLMIFCGILMKKYHSDEPNSAMGYRTKRSMKNNDTWKFANEFAGRLWIKAGIILAVISALVDFSYFYVKENYGVYVMLSAVILQSVMMVLTICPVEKALKSNFDDNGKEKSQ